ncbi:ubiquitin-like small modifier protein 1 [Halomarina ordinaria]|uniref:Ubiquitin-like small modifier protein 1 n=1 Tax=Halomarina ordinaria TaxID=3033939 RepID=A0ABD5U575_9EURY|nr:ubiquitin-like small modifier protein 1 [Halomarina sp. PSRA2]
MEVELRLFATFRERVGERTLDRAVAPGTTVRDLLAALEADYPALDGELLDGEGTPPSVAVLHDGKRADLDAELTPDDRVSICPPVTGGNGT